MENQLPSPPVASRKSGQIRTFPLETQFEILLASKHKGLQSLLSTLQKWRRKRYSDLEDLRQRHPLNLLNFEHQIYSQNGEDGILQEIFARIGAGSKYLVEFGSQDGLENCTRNLVENHGWLGLWIEGDPQQVVQAQQKFSSYGVQIISRLLTTENILDVFFEANVPNDFDLLSLDVDGNDYHLWKKLLSKYAPRVVVIEYNASFRPKTRWVMPYNPNHRWDGTSYYGASIRSLYELGLERGYQLVGCDSFGVNLFFVRKDLICPEKWDLKKNLKDYYVSPKFHPDWFGHPNFIVHKRKSQSKTFSRGSLSIEWQAAPINKVENREIFQVFVTITNLSDYTLQSCPPQPIHISYQWKSIRTPEREVQDGKRTRIFPQLPKKSSRDYGVSVIAPEFLGPATLTVTLVEEGIQWFSASPFNLSVNAAIDIV